MPNHHAVVFIADALADVLVLPLSLRTPSMDVMHIATDRLSIDMVRDLVLEAQVRPVTSSYKTHVIVARDVPVEAQNALLKLFEEPPLSARFILIIPRADMLLPTVRSRVHLVSAEAAVITESAEFIQFLKASYALRLELAAKWAKEKDLHSMEQILRGAEKYAHEQVVVKPALLSSILFIRDYFGLSGAARKILLEELALVLPKG